MLAVWAFEEFEWLVQADSRMNTDALQIVRTRWLFGTVIRCHVASSRKLLGFIGSVGDGSFDHGNFRVLALVGSEIRLIASIED